MTENVKDTGEWVQASSAKGKAVVFGRIRWLENGVERKIGKTMFDFYVKPGLLRLEDRSRQIAQVSESGEFAWTLKPGTYVIYRINYRDTWSGNYFFVPKTAFLVPDQGKAIYIGTLKAEYAPKRDFLGGLSGMAKFSIEDEESAAYPVISEDLKIGPSEIRKSLMVREERLPRTIDTTPEFQLATQLLNALLQAM